MIGNTDADHDCNKYSALKLRWQLIFVTIQDGVAASPAARF